MPIRYGQQPGRVAPVEGRPLAPGGVVANDAPRRTSPIAIATSSFQSTAHPENRISSFATMNDSGARIPATGSRNGPLEVGLLAPEGGERQRHHRVGEDGRRRDEPDELLPPRERQEQEHPARERERDREGGDAPPVQHRERASGCSGCGRGRTSERELVPTYSRPVPPGDTIASM